MAATEVDGVFYPVDARGCFYAEFYDPEIQKKDSKIIELMEKINSEPSFVFALDNNINALWPRHASGTVPGFFAPNSTKLPAYTERQVDGIIADQRLCFNERSGEWEHVLDFVLARGENTTPKGTYVVRVVDGWLKGGGYESFTYLQEVKKVEGKGVSISDLSSKEAATITNAFDMYSDLIESKEQVGLRLPDRLLVEKGMDPVTAMRQLSEVLANYSHSLWSDNNKDPDFLAWVTRADNQVAYFGDKQHMDEIYVKNSTTRWRYMGEQAASGSMPELVVREVQVAEK